VQGRWSSIKMAIGILDVSDGSASGLPPAKRLS